MHASYAGCLPNAKRQSWVKGGYDTDAERGVVLRHAQKVPDHQHWRFNRTDVSAVNAILEGFCTGPMKNRFGRRVRAKLGADLAEVLRLCATECCARCGSSGVMTPVDLMAQLWCTGAAGI